MENREKFVSPDVEIIGISEEDVITTSGIQGDDDGMGDSIYFGKED